MPDGRVLVAFDADALTASPTWTRIDNVNNLVAGIDIRRGRQTEFDRTETSTATVRINDRTGLFDPDNSSSTYFGKLDGKQIMLQLYDPFAAAWVPQFRGHIDDYGYDFNPAINHDGEPLVSNISIECVDLFDYLGGVEMLPGTFGDVAPAGSEGTVFYEDTDFQTRVTQALTDAGLPSGMFRVFTGNVDLLETKYDPGDSVMVVVRDAVDAEFPGIANVYTDKLGRVCAHGRFARLDPDTTVIGTDWSFTRWPAGDGIAIIADPTRAQIRPPLSWSRPRSRIINAALAYPRGMAETAMPGQVYVDTVSRGKYGYRAWSAPDLILAAGSTTGNNAVVESKLYAQHYVENYKNPMTRVEALTFKSLPPDDARAEASWALMAGVDVSDIVDLEHGYPGGVGISQEMFVEGSEMSIRPLNPDYDMVELTVNVSPRETVDVFS